MVVFGHGEHGVEARRGDDEIVRQHGTQSHPRFRVHHALRIKGFVKVENLAELAGLPEEEVLVASPGDATGRAHQLRENRGLWQIHAGWSRAPT